MEAKEIERETIYLQASQELLLRDGAYPKEAVVRCVCNMNLGGHVISRLLFAHFACYPIRSC